MFPKKPFEQNNKAVEKTKDKPVRAIPQGFHTVTPFLVVDNAAGLIEFIKSAFDGKQTFRMDENDGKIMHATVTIGDSTIMISDKMEGMEAQTAMLYLYVEDADALFKNALRAKATQIHEPTTEFYGDRAGAVKDSWGNIWWIATHVEDVEHNELKKRAEQAMKERKEKGDTVHA